MAKITPEQAASRHGIRAERVRGWIRTGHLPARKYGPMYLIEERDLLAAIAHPPRIGGVLGHDGTPRSMR